MRGDYIGENVKNIKNLYGFSNSIDASDRIEIFPQSCNECSRASKKGVFTILNIGALGMPNTITGNNAFPPFNLQ